LRQQGMPPVHIFADLILARQIKYFLPCFQKIGLNFYKKIAYFYICFLKKYKQQKNRIFCGR